MLVDKIRKLEEKTNRLKAREKFANDLCELLVENISNPLFKNAEKLKGSRRYLALHTAARVEQIGFKVWSHYSRLLIEYKRKLLDEKVSLRDYVISGGLAKPNYAK